MYHCLSVQNQSSEFSYFLNNPECPHSVTLNGLVNHTAFLLFISLSVDSLAWVPCSLIVPSSPLCTLQTSWYLPEAPALWSAQHHYGVSVRWSGLGFPWNRCSASKFKRQREPGSRDRGKHWVRQNCHHLQTGGPQLPWNTDETDRLWQPTCLPQT